MAHRWGTVLLAAGLLLAGCDSGHSSASSAGCRPPAQEQLDPRSTQHLFPGVPDPVYLTDPPTSGPHRLGPPPTGAVTTPIARSVQVAMLESGFVIVQYHRLGPAGIGALSALAGDHVTVAPANTGPAPAVATAWTWKLACSTVDTAALRAFIAAHRGAGPSHS